MQMLQYIFTGLVELVMAELANHKADILALLSKLFADLLTALKNAGHTDAVKQIQAVVASHDVP